MSDKAELFIDCRNELGEGPFWHPGRGELFWFDIMGHTLNNADTSGKILNCWDFGEPVAAAAIIDNDNLLVAAASGLLRFSVADGSRSLHMPLESDNPDTRTNDSRVNPAGGFWIGTMSLGGAGAIGAVYQYRAGKIDQLMRDISTPNSTCFSPDGRTAYWADTPTGIIRRCAIDPETGLPAGDWEDHIDTNGHPGAPDGSVVDSEGYLWNARWDGSRVIRYTPDGKIDREIELPVSKVTCPAFGGADLKTLYVTSAYAGFSEQERAAEPHAGNVFSIEVDVAGLPENKIVL